MVIWVGNNNQNVRHLSNLKKLLMTILATLIVVELGEKMDASIKV